MVWGFFFAFVISEAILKEATNNLSLSLVRFEKKNSLTF
jgi:hypothetical protein